MKCHNVLLQLPRCKLCMFTVDITDYQNGVINCNPCCRTSNIIWLFSPGPSKC